MPTTDEEVAKKAAHVQRLREQVAAAQDQRVTRVSELSNDITMRQLEVEESRLQAQLDLAKNDAKVTTVKAGASTLLDTIKEDQANADAFAKAQEAARAASAPTGGVTAKEAEAQDKKALEDAAKANAKASAEGATNVPEGLAESTTTEPKRDSSTVADTTKG
jgi:cytochrome c1